MLDIGSFVLNHLDGYIGIGRLEALKQLHQEIPRHQAGDADGQFATQAFGAQLQAALGIIHRCQDQVGLAQELVPLVGQVHSLGVALEQPDANVGFQLLDR
ncbi:hypothetical protein D3C80_1730790 [compost metagenome]